MRTCTKCNQDKDETSFNRGKCWCKVCYVEYNKSPARKKQRSAYATMRYRTNLPHREKVRTQANARRETIQEYKYEYLKTHPCVDCGETDPIVLEFDHRDPKEKSFTIGQAKDNLNKVIAEIAKCDVRCANCHARKTAQQFNYKKNQIR